MARMPQGIMAGQEACVTKRIPLRMANMDLLEVTGIGGLRSESGGSSAFDWYMSHDTSVVGRQAYPKNLILIRCIKENNEPLLHTFLGCFGSD